MGNLKLVARFLCFILSGCGSSNPALQSINIHQQVATDFPQFTASGTLMNGRQTNPLCRQLCLHSFP